MGSAHQESPSLAAFADATAACGTHKFHHALLDAVGKIISWDTCGVVQFSKFSVPQYIVTRNVPQHEIDYYVAGFYRLDPYFRHWRESELSGVVSLKRVSKTQDPSDYQSSFQPRTGMQDEVGVICPKFPGVADDFFFMRALPYSAEELQRLDAAFPLIEQLYKLNNRLSLQNLETGFKTSDHNGAGGLFAVLDQAGKIVFEGIDWSQTVGDNLGLSEAVSRLAKSDRADSLPFPGGFVSSLDLEANHALSPGGKLLVVTPGDEARASTDLHSVVDQLFADQLTSRELEVCKLILAGHPTAGIATVLNISIGTIKNHRKSIHRKLDITSERELFLAVIAWLAP